MIMNATQYKMPILLQRQNIEKSKDLFDHYTKKGQLLLKQDKVALCIFVQEQEINKISGEQQLNQQIRFQKPLEQLKKYLATLKQFFQMNKRIYSQVFVFTDHFQYSKVKELINSLEISQLEIKIVLSKLHSVLNQEGQFCLRSERTCDLLQRPAGNQDFLQFLYQGKRIQSILKQSAVQFVVALSCEQLQGNPIDQFFIGYMQENKQSFDLIYKCYKTNENTNKFTYQRLVSQKGITRVINQNNLFDSIHNRKFNMKVSTQFQQKYQKFPIWGNSFIFSLQKLEIHKKVCDKTNDYNCLNVKKKTLTHWDPYSKSYVKNKKCFVLEKALTNIFYRKDLKTLGLISELKTQINN